MNIRTKLVLGLLIVLCFNLSVGFYAVWQQKEQSRRAAQILALSIQIVETSLSAQVHFKKQVQEWKNVLLRGHEPELYDKYLTQFYEQERNTRDMIEALMPLISEHPEAHKTAKEFLFAHMRLGHDYREAFRYYSINESKPHIMVDNTGEEE